MSELKPCADCGREVPKSEMFGAPGDKRCGDCAQAFGKRMDPGRSHSIAQASSGTRKARRRKTNLILGGILGVGFLVAWFLPGRTTDAPVEERGTIVVPERGLPPEVVYFQRHLTPPTGEGPTIPTARLAATLPTAIAGWTHVATAPRSGAAASVDAVFERGEDGLAIRLTDGGRPRASDLRAFRAAANATYGAFPAVEQRTDEGRLVRVLIAGRFWLDLAAPARKDLLAALSGVDRAKLTALAKD